MSTGHIAGGLLSAEHLSTGQMSYVRVIYIIYGVRIVWPGQFANGHFGQDFQLGRTVWPIIIVQ